MDINKINATLSKALVHIQEGEAEDLRKLALGEEGEELSSLEEALSIIADAVKEATGNEDEKVVIEAVSEVIGEAAAKHLAGTPDLTDDNIVEWLSKQSGLVEAVTEHLKKAA